VALIQNVYFFAVLDRIASKTRTETDKMVFDRLDTDAAGHLSQWLFSIAANLTGSSECRRWSEIALIRSPHCFGYWLHCRLFALLPLHSRFRQKLF
jgi:hypothetical protein